MIDRPSTIIQLKTPNKRFVIIPCPYCSNVSRPLDFNNINSNFTTWFVACGVCWRYYGVKR